MGAAVSSLWFFISPIPDVSNKGKFKQVSSFMMSVSCMFTMILLYWGKQFYDLHPGFPIPFPPWFFPGMLILCCCCCCSTLKLLGQARKMGNKK